MGGGGDLTANFTVHLLTHSLCPRPGKLGSNNSMRKKDPEVQLYSRQKTGYNTYIYQGVTPLVSKIFSMLIGRKLIQKRRVSENSGFLATQWRLPKD